MRGGLLRRKPGEALSHLQNKDINIFDKDRKMIEFFMNRATLEPRSDRITE